MGICSHNYYTKIGIKNISCWLTRNWCLNFYEPSIVLVATRLTGRDDDSNTFKRYKIQIYTSDLFNSMLYSYYWCLFKEILVDLNLMFITTWYTTHFFRFLHEKLQFGLMEYSHWTIRNYRWKYSGLPLRKSWLYNIHFVENIQINSE